ncbi:hypothetical protein C8R44DRAFT_751317 [Mycena epipterygia]|nr:hypothetical protein C8R44DRAFT_751317 [Mycena epipterygia]
MSINLCGYRNTLHIPCAQKETRAWNAVEENAVSFRLDLTRRWHVLLELSGCASPRGEAIHSKAAAKEHVRRGKKKENSLRNGKRVEDRETPIGHTLVSRCVTVTISGQTMVHRTTRKKPTTASSSSQCITLQSTDFTTSGRAIRSKRTLNPSKVRTHKDEEFISEEQRLRENALRDYQRDIPTIDNEDFGFAAVFDGTERTATPESMFLGTTNETRRICGKTFENHTTIYMVVAVIIPEMPAIADAYMVWDARSSEDGLGTLLGPPNDCVIENYFSVLVIDLFGASNFPILGGVIEDVPMLAGDVFVSSGLVNLGYFPSSSDKPSTVFTTRMLEVFRVTFNHALVTSG